jgi:hypothetical protein
VLVSGPHAAKVLQSAIPSAISDFSHTKMNKFCDFFTRFGWGDVPLSIPSIRFALFGGIRKPQAFFDFVTGSAMRGMRLHWENIMRLIMGLISHFLDTLYILYTCIYNKICTN